MEFDFFDSLTNEEARTYCARFLKCERTAVEGMEADARVQGLSLDYSLESVPRVLYWLLDGVPANHVPVPLSEPWWVRQCHKEGILEFEGDARVAILRAAFYLGECFVRAFPTLSWSTGDAESMENTMPVVTGFRHHVEMAPIMVCEVICQRIYERRESLEGLRAMVQAWTSDVP